jgi:peptidoglycan-N-acetylglucosamine deacetylase
MSLRTVWICLGLLCCTTAIPAESNGQLFYTPPPDGAKDAPFPWPEGKRCAVSLSFDDARYSQVDVGIPLLNKYDIDATFYINPNRVEERLSQWKQAVADGHELGNHTISHPCTGSYPFSRWNALEDYTLDMIEREMLDCNAAIERLLGFTMHSFGYPCGQKYVGRGKELRSYVPVVAKHFLAARGWLGENSNNPVICDLTQLLGMEIDGMPFDKMREITEEAARNNAWLIFAGHDIGPAANQVTIDAELEIYCRYLTDPSNGIWVETIQNVAGYVQKQRKQ